MEKEVVVAVIAASTSIIVASITAGLTYWYSKKKEFETQWQNEKLNHYKVLLSAISDLAVSGTNKQDANMRFALASNTIALVAPQYVIKALMTFHSEIKYSNPNPSQENEEAKLKQLLLAVRKDIGRAINDNVNTFDFHLIGYNPEFAKPQHVAKAS